MGSPLRLTLGAGAPTARRRQPAWRTVVAAFELAEDAMSRFRETSEITTFNRVAGRSVRGAGRRVGCAQALVAADRRIGV